MPQANPRFPVPKRAAGPAHALDHFLFLAKNGRRSGASGGEKRAAILAAAVRDHVPGLDSVATAGLIEFIELTEVAPGTAQDLVA